MVYIRKKGAMAWPHPKYDNKSNYITLILYFGGSFKNTVYEGGDKLVFDWIKTNEFKFSDLVEFSAKAGVKGQNKYHIRLKSGSFKYVIDDEDLRVWANKFLDTREIHVYVEPFDGSENESETEAPNFLEIEFDYDSCEDPDFVIGNELTDNDDEFFEGNVDTLEGDVESLDPKNIFDSTYHVWIELGGEGGNLGDGDSVGGDKGKNPVQEEIGGEGGNLGDGDSVGGDKGKNPLQEEIGGEGGNLGDGDSVGGGLGTKGRNVDSESEGEVEYEKDVVGGEGEYFDEHRLSEDDDETPNAPVFNPQTTFNPEFNVRQLFASKTEFRKAVQSGAIRDRRNVHFPKNDNRRIYAKCRDKFCGWHIHALKKQKETTFQIRKYNGIHTCVPSLKVKNLTATWLSERFIQKFQSDGNRDVNGRQWEAVQLLVCFRLKDQRRRTRSSYLVDEISDHEAVEEMANEDPVDEQHNDTQQSTTTNVTWNQLSPQPQQGPSQHDQLELGQPVTSRVQMRRPPRFGEGHFSRTLFVAPQQKDKTKLFVEGEQKYMEGGQNLLPTLSPFQVVAMIAGRRQRHRKF
ncbi:hypothetical protein ACS0TY_026542 [Phlomoides rotata]